MAYDERLAKRIRAGLRGTRGVSEKRMFGGIAFLVRGHMCCGVVGDELMVRVGPAAYAAALARRHARPMDFTGRAMKGFVFVAPAGLRSGRQRASWIERALAFVRSLPAK